ncbi:EF-hand domain-containing D2 [Pelobates cultripes]|uniref:EF-hand domain-containing D2 n=1 Tax=Pelobates cultripes TaxID=61616 RepID=A0AAD1W271_PELCU|nr:EF-hand domain-containing D2 [Pelobates cultripes]
MDSPAHMGAAASSKPHLHATHPTQDSQISTAPRHTALDDLCTAEHETIMPNTAGVGTEPRSSIGAAAGELEEDSGLHALARHSEIDVSTEGVKGVKNFFEAKVQAINHGSWFEQEIKAEQEEKKRQAEEKEQRKAAFKELQSAFKP